MSPAMSDFILLPTELQIKILLQLDNHSLIRCSSVCKGLAGLISSEVALQYKLELASAGMIDGPLGPSQASLSERLEKMKAYRAAWHKPPIIFDKRFPQRPPRLQILRVTGGILPYSTGLVGGLGFWKPGSSLRGVPEVRLSCNHALQSMKFSSVSVDLGQDLVVLTTETLYPNSLNVNTYEVRLLTTACVPHPLAAQSQLRSAPQRPPPPYNPRCISSTEIFGDLLAWSASTDLGQILVWNWKTGDVLLRLTPYADASCFKFLDNSHFLILFDQDLRIYELQQPISESHQTTIADCPCVLRLPAFAPGAVFLLNKKLHTHSSSSPSSTAPLFRHDPDLKIVCVTLRMRYISGQAQEETKIENFMFLIPVATLLAHFHRVRSAAETNASAAREVPWEDWGPVGSRVFVTAFYEVGISGTKVIAAPQIGWDATDKHPRHRFFVIDLNPFAAYGLGLPSTPSGDPAELREGGYVTSCKSFKGPIRSQLQCTTTLLCDGTLVLEPGADPRQRSGWHELVVFEDQWALVYLEHYQDPCRFTSEGVYTFEI